jgi:predicted nucleotidyltransferase component of viral defense system
MLTTNELKGYAHMRRLRLVDQIWKDYLQDLALHLLYRKAPGLVFRGDTCIWKLYRGDRFSEDLDLCGRSVPGDVGDYVARELGFLGFDCTVKRKRTENMEFMKLTVVSPAHPRPVVLGVEVLESGECASRSHPATLHSPYPDVPPVELRAQGAGAIAVDKVAAIFGRDKPRDVHDLYTLLRQGERPDMAEVRRRVPGFSHSGLRRRRPPSLDEEVRYIMVGLKG